MSEPLCGGRTGVWNWWAGPIVFDKKLNLITFAFQLDWDFIFSYNRGLSRLNSGNL